MGTCRPRHRNGSAEGQALCRGPGQGGLGGFQGPDNPFFFRCRRQRVTAERAKLAPSCVSKIVAQLSKAAKREQTPLALLNLAYLLLFQAPRMRMRNKNRI